ncbi:putative G protein alpha subunit GNA-3 [Roridomyces roridus]|uniref:G protein alpha subunit GNA-3 n=1 Tax=Roridomyces roridus TaxID=1738132 RepID=A0AAD7BEM6_9AGAR|nr:putative G protein alpha subunit GNA-3 [Roridomyces roridus]
MRHACSDTQERNNWKQHAARDVENLTLPVILYGLPSRWTGFTTFTRRRDDSCLILVSPRVHSMGQPASKESRTDRARSDAIDRQIAADSKRYKKECKILLLGSGESGKSTIVKQMKIIHQRGFDEKARADFRYTIYRNVLDSAGTLAQVVRRIGVPALGEDGRWAGQLLQAFPAIVRADVDVDVDTLDGDGDTLDGHFGRRRDLEDGAVEVGLDPVPFTRATERRGSEWDDRILVDDLTPNQNLSAGGGRRPTDWELAGLPSSAPAGRRPSDWEARRPTTANSNHGGNGFPGSGAPDAFVLTQTHTLLTPALADAIWHISRSPAVERAVDEHPGEFYLMDSASYFFREIHRIAAPTYVPSEEDVLRARAKSTAIIETRFWMGDLSIHMFDVGGQRSERKKWIHCFESVTSIIFCTALSEYDQVLEEERRVNRMRESLYLFESVINSRWFLRTSVILFLNKIDVFKRKLPKIPLGRFFAEYAGGNDLHKAAKYILWKFMQENRAKLTVYPHVTQATNTKNIRLVFAAVKETILQNALKDSGIL